MRAGQATGAAKAVAQTTVTGVHANQLRGWRNEQLAIGSAEALVRQKAEAAELVRLRREVADPPAGPDDGVPVEALEGGRRKGYQLERRRQGPLGRGQPWTWRALLIKVAARVAVSGRRVLVLLSGSWPHLGHYRRVSEHVSGRPAVRRKW